MHGWSRQYVNKLVKNKTIPVNEKKKVDVNAAIQALKDAADPARTLVEKPEEAQTTLDDQLEETPIAAIDENTSSFQSARTMREQTNAEIAKLTLEEKQGKLVDKAEVEKQVMKLFRDLREVILNAPASFSGKLITLSSEREVTVFLEEGLTQLLNDFSESIDQQKS